MFCYMAQGGKNLKMSFESQTKKPIFQLEIILLVVIVYSIMAYILGDVFSSWSANTNPFIALFVYWLINPLNWYIVYGLTKDYKLIGFISSIFITIIIDIISLPHSIFINGGVNPESLASYSDTSLWNGLFSKIPGMFGTLLMYIFLGVVIVFILLIIIKKPKKFVDIFRRAA